MSELLTDLAARQAALVHALVRGTAAPPGFDPIGVERTAHTLVRKRWAAVRRHWPMLTAGLIGRYGGGPAACAVFEEWARAHREAGGLPLGGFADGFCFAAWEEARAGLPTLGAPDVAAARLSWRIAAPGAPVGTVGLEPRRWIGIGSASAGGYRLWGWGRSGTVRRTLSRAPRHADVG